MFAARPLHPPKRICRPRLVLSQKGHFRTHARSKTGLFDQLIGAAAQRERYGDAERLEVLRLCSTLVACCTGRSAGF
jgi:hypothetical protein